MKNFIQFINESLITELNYSTKGLKVLPDLPDSLQKLYCHYNQLRVLPDLPDSLQYLYCYNNQLQVLPQLPDSLQQLYCWNNPIESFIPEKFWKQQDKKWLEEYINKIKSYKFQKEIWEKYGEEHLIQFIKYLDPRIQEESNLVQAYLHGFI